MKRLPCILILGIVITCTVSAAQMTVGDLLKFCTSSSEQDKTACSFYIWGVTEGAKLVASEVKDNSGTYKLAKDKPFCIPDDISMTAMELLVRAKIGEDLAVFPDDRNLPAVTFVVAVLTKQFPCGKPK